MYTPFVMIILLFGAGSGYGASVHPVGFISMEACEAAKVQVLEQNTQSSHQLTVICAKR